MDAPKAEIWLVNQHGVAHCPAVTAQRQSSTKNRVRREWGGTDPAAMVLPGLQPSSCNDATDAPDRGFFPAKRPERRISARRARILGHAEPSGRGRHEGFWACRSKVDIRPNDRQPPFARVARRLRIG